MWNGPGVLTAAVKESCDIREDKDIYDFDNKKIIDNTCADITFIPPQEAGVLIR